MLFSFDIIITISHSQTPTGNHQHQATSSSSHYRNPNYYGTPPEASSSHYNLNVKKYMCPINGHECTFGVNHKSSLRRHSIIQHKDAEKARLDYVLMRLSVGGYSEFISPRWKAIHEPASLRYLVQLEWYRLSTWSYLTFCTLTLSHAAPGSDTMASGRSDNSQSPKPSTASGTQAGSTSSSTSTKKKAEVTKPARYLVQWYRLRSYLTFCTLTLSPAASGSGPSQRKVWIVGVSIDWG